MNQTSTSRIARNTIFLYLRMFVVMGIGLYTSRIVLEALGFVDYGIFNVVGGVIGLFGFISTSMNSASARFFNTALGKDDFPMLVQLFKGSITSHLFIAVAVLIACETIGLWLLDTKLNIPAEKKISAQIVYQLSIFMTMISIIQTPFSALLISHEKMDSFAFIEIVNVLLKLVAVLSLLLILNDRLVYYIVFLTCNTLIIFIVYVAVCKRKFKCCHIGLIFKKETLLPLISFSGWDLYGNMSVVARAQGVNVLLNVFFGTVVNAASGIANQVQVAINQFSSNILMAFRPQIIKSYAAGNNYDAIRLTIAGAKYTSVLLLTLCVPLIINIDFILNIWLGRYPEYTPVFCVWSIIFIIIANLSSCVMILIHATGKIRLSSILNGTLYLLVIPLSYLFFKNKSEPVAPFIINVIAVGIGCSLNIVYVSCYIPEFSIRHFVAKSFFPVIVIAIINVLSCNIIRCVIQDHWWRLISAICTSVLLSALCTYFIVLDKNSRQSIISNIRKHVSG